MDLAATLLPNAMLRLRAFGTLLLFCLATAPMLAAAAPPRPLSNLEHRRWISADGGPSQVGAIAQTPDGYLWLGTNESLFRFDGFRFVRFEPGMTNTLNIVSSMLVAEQELWVGLRFGGVRVISQGSMREFRPGSGLPEGVIYGLAQDRGKAIWAAADDGLARYADGAWQRIGEAWNFGGSKASAVFTDRDGVLWAASENRLLYLPDGARRFVDAGLAVSAVSQIAQAADGAIWLAERYSGKMHRVVLDQGQATTTSANMPAAAMNLLFDRAGGLWISTTGQGIRYVANPHSLAGLRDAEVFTSHHGLSSDFIWKMFEDAEGNLWVGTNAGLDRFRKRALTMSSLPPAALNFALAAGGDGSLWAGPSNDAAMHLLGDKLTHLAMPPPVNSATRDHEGTVWMGGPSGIWRAQGAQLVQVAALPASAHMESPVRAMARDHAGDLWVSLNRLGLYKLSNGHWSAVPGVSDRPAQRMPVTASTDADGRLWFGYRDSLLVARQGRQERRWTPAQGLDLGHITALAHDAGRTWVGGERGAGYIQDERFHRLQLPQNGLFNYIYAIIPVPVREGQGVDLWIHAKAGIFQIVAAELRRAAADPAHRLRYRSHDLMGGLANDPYQVLPLPTAVRGKDGRLWFSTSGGVAWINPYRLPSPSAGPNVIIESVSVDGARVSTAGPLTLAPGTQRIEIDYTALSLSAPERLNFRYRLDGYEADWHDNGRERQATYTGLDPGQYTFRVIALDKDGLTSEREAALAFHIAPAFYRQPVFIALAAVLAVLLLWMVYQTNLRRAGQRLRDRLEERHRERERIARELHDTLLQGVNGLVLCFQSVADRMPADDPARARLELALDRADQVLVEGRDRVRDLRHGLQRAGSLAQALAALGNDLASRGGTAFALQESGAARDLLPLAEDEAYRIAHEALVNAFTHSGAPLVRVEISHGQAFFRMTVADNGQGIDAAYLGPRGRPEHWGLRGMHERAERLGATLSIHSEPMRGAAVTLSIAADLAYCQSRPRCFGWRSIFHRQGVQG